MSLVIPIVLIFVLPTIIKCKTIDDNGVMPLKFHLHYIFDDGDMPLESCTGFAAIQFKLAENKKHLGIVYSGVINDIQIKNLNDSTESVNFNYSVDCERHRIENNDSHLFKINNVYEVLLNFTQMEYGQGLEKVFANNGSPIVYTSELQSIGFPSFGAKQINAVFELKVTHNSSFSAISNTPGTRVRDNETNQTTTQFEKTSNISSNLFGFVIGQFTSRHIKNHRNFTLSMYGPESKITDFFGNIFSEYETYLDCMIPAVKLDLVVIPKLSTGFMKLGLIFVEEEMFFDRIDPRDALIGINMVSKAIGDHFIIDSFESNVKWFNQGLTSYLADKMLQNLEPHIEQIIAFEDLHNVMFKEYAIVDFNLAEDVDYHKSAAIFRMIEHIIGGTKFQTCLKNALKLEQNFTELLAESFDGNIDFFEFINKWIHQTGYPVIKMVRNYETGEIYLSQNAIDWHSDAIWSIPFNFATKLNPNFNQTIPDDWLTVTNTTVMLNVSVNNWIMCNKQATGYYLINYDERNMNLIIDELRNGSMENIHPLNRASLLTTSFLLTLTKDMADDTFLRLMSYLERENDPRPWFVADQILEKLHKDSFNRERTYVDHLSNVISSISQNLYDNYTIGINPFTRYIAMKWACRSGYVRCLTDFDQLSIKYLKSIEDGTTIPITPDIKDLMICHGFQNESDYVRLYSYDSNEFRQMIKNRIDCHLNTNVFRWEFMKSFIFKMFNYRTYFDQLNWMEYIEYVPGFNLRVGDLVFEVFEKNLSEFDAIYVEIQNTELKLLPFKYINELLARYKKQIKSQGYEFNGTRFDQMVATINQQYGKVAAGSIVLLTTV